MIDIKLIEFDTTSTTKEEVFNKLSNLVVNNGYAKDVDFVKKALVHRENEGTTGMLDGFAIPHAKSASIISPVVAVLKLKNGIEWESMDGNLIVSVISLFIPEEESGKAHLQYLSKIAKLLMRDDFKRAFNKASNPEEIFNVFNTYLEL